MRSQNCNQIQDDLKAYLDHELSPLRRWTVARHLAGCAECRQELKEMAQIVDEISSKQDGALSDVTKEQLTASMMSAAGSAPKVTRRPLRPLELGAAAVGVFVVATILFPVFAKVREKARQVADSPTIALSIPEKSAYTQDYDEHLPGDVHIAPPPASDYSTDASGVVTSAPHTVDGAQISSNSESLYANSSPVVAEPIHALPAQQDNVTVSPDTQADEDAGRQVHKSATITVQVKDPEAIGEQVEEDARTAGGYVTSSDLTTSNDGTKSDTMTLKVPLPQFEATLSQIAKLGDVQDKEVTGEDITDKVSDADQREQVLEDDMDQALDQLKKKGTHASWDLQQDARDLRIQLAQSRARLQLLRSLAELSEIDVTLAQPDKPAPPVQSGFFADLSNSSQGALQSGAGAIVTLISLLLWIVAYSPLWAPTLLIGRWLWKRYNAAYDKAQ